MGPDGRAPLREAAGGGGADAGGQPPGAVQGEVVAGGAVDQNSPVPEGWKSAANEEGGE